MKKKNIFFWFFLFILLTTFYFDFNKTKLNSIEVIGLSEENNFKVYESLKFLLTENIFFINEKELQNILTKNNLIDYFYVKKIYPSLIKVKIKQTDLLAITNKNNKKFYIGANGKVPDGLFFVTLISVIKDDVFSIPELYLADAVNLNANKSPAGNTNEPVLYALVSKLASLSNIEGCNNCPYLPSQSLNAIELELLRYASFKNKLPVSEE